MKDAAVPLPSQISSEEKLLDQLTRPGPALVEFIRSVSSPLVVIGAGGKMGPTLCVLAQRAAELAGHDLQVVAASRFSDPTSRAWIESRGIRTTQVDLLDRDSTGRLPDSANVIYLVGLKFGTADNPALTWATNTLAPAHVCARYAQSRIVALSTGNVYPNVPASSDGPTESHPLTPKGEYANAAVARERIFEFFSARDGIRVALLRLNYAVELRYGVLLDVARKVWENQRIDLANGYFNCIWQGDANDMILRSLALAESPVRAWNLSSPEKLSVRAVANRFGELLDRSPCFEGQEADDALLTNAAALCGQLGSPATPLDTVIRWTAHWIRQGGASLDRPTHFEVRDGEY